MSACANTHALAYATASAQTAIPSDAAGHQLSDTATDHTPGDEADTQAAETETGCERANRRLRPPCG